MSRKGKGKRMGGLPPRNPSLESTASQNTAPSPRFGNRGSLEGGAPISAYGSYLFDCLSLVIYCSKHNRFALCPIGKGKSNWLPFVALKSAEGWYPAACNRLKQLLGTSGNQYISFSAPEMIHIFRLHLPTIARFVNRVTFMTTLTNDPASGDCCKPLKSGLTWVSLADLMGNKVQDLWGPEPMVFGDAVASGLMEKGTYTEYTLRDALKYLPREPPKTYQDEMLKSAQFSEKDVQKLYAEFIQHAFPSQYMSPYSFCNYMTKIGWRQGDLELSAVFRAFGFNNFAYLTFHEFLLGIAALDKHTNHGGHPGELRCGYIFRYYDSDLDGKLNGNEMFKMTVDILRCKNKPTDQQSVEAEMAKNMQSIGKQIGDVVKLEELLKGVGTMAFRGSSALFRSSIPIMQNIHTKRCYDSLSMISSLSDVASGRKPRGTCPRCRTKKYTLAYHTVKIFTDGSVIDPVEVNQEDVKNMPKEKRQHATTEFSADNIANRILDWIREYVASLGMLGKSDRKKVKPSNFWQQSDRSQLANAVLKLCAEAERIFKQEPRVLKVNSPAYVLGDIHGNLHDLMVYEKSLWDKGPCCTAASYLFLGDYVDRGDYGLEVVLYLLSCKVLAPEKYFLLRGNHELRPIQMVFTFQRECNDKFAKFGPQIWDACNRVFDVLPLCAVIDESIFCAHGGIPVSVSRVEELNSIPCPLQDPENQSPASWEILWNDPVNSNEFGEYADLLRVQTGTTTFANIAGFLPNTKRGTAYYYSDDSVSKFLKDNQLSHIIRAHEVIPPGFAFHCGGRVITIFSSSRYCGGLNEAAVVFVEREMLRICRMETTNI